MLIKFILASFLSSISSGFVPINPIAPFATYSQASSLATPEKSYHARIHSPSLDSFQLGSTEHWRDDDMTLYLVIAKVLHEIVASSLEFDGVGKIVNHDNSSSLTISDELLWKVVNSLDYQIETIIPNLSPEEKAFVKAALKEVSKNDIKMVVEEIIEQ
ncbi:MAG: hypothetical protein AB8G05_13625 [Oligoflexales bacterium]